MTDTHQKKIPVNLNTANMIGAGVAGAIAGGVAVVTAVLMSDKKNQKKVKEAFFEAKNKITEYVDKARS